MVLDTTPFFIPDGYNRTFAQLDSGNKKIKFLTEQRPYKNVGVFKNTLVISFFLCLA